jgi:hypothetical protein
MIAPQGETPEPDAFFALCAASHALYPDFVSEIEELSGQEVGFRREGSLLVAVEEKQVAELEKLFWTQTRAGLPLERLTPACSTRCRGFRVRSGLPSAFSRLQQAAKSYPGHWSLSPRHPFGSRHSSANLRAGSRPLHLSLPRSLSANPLCVMAGRSSAQDDAARKSESVTTLAHTAVEIPKHPRVLCRGGESFDGHSAHRWSRYFRTIAGPLTCPCQSTNIPLRGYATES